MTKTFHKGFELIELFINNIGSTPKEKKRKKKKEIVYARLILGQNDHQ